MVWASCCFPFVLLSYRCNRKRLLRPVDRHAVLNWFWHLFPTFLKSLCHQVFHASIAALLLGRSLYLCYLTRPVKHLRYLLQPALCFFWRICVPLTCNPVT